MGNFLALKLRNIAPNEQPIYKNQERFTFKTPCLQKSSCEKGLGCHVRRPGRLLNAAFSGWQTESHTAIDRYRTENAVFTAFGGIEHDRAVRRDTGALIKTRLGKYRQPVGHQIKHRNVIPTVSLMNQRDITTILRYPRPGVITPLKSDLSEITVHNLFCGRQFCGLFWLLKLQPHG